MKTHKTDGVSAAELSSLSRTYNLALYAEPEIEAWYDDFMRRHGHGPSLAYYHRVVREAYQSAAKFVKEMRQAGLAA